MKWYTWINIIAMLLNCIAIFYHTRNIKLLREIERQEMELEKRLNKLDPVKIIVKVDPVLGTSITFAEKYHLPEHIVIAMAQQTYYEVKIYAYSPSYTVISPMLGNEFSDYNSRKKIIYEQL